MQLRAPDPTPKELLQLPPGDSRPVARSLHRAGVAALEAAKAADDADVRAAAFEEANGLLARAAGAFDGDDWCAAKTLHVQSNVQHYRVFSGFAGVDVLRSARDCALQAAVLYRRSEQPLWSAKVAVNAAVLAFELSRRTGEEPPETVMSGLEAARTVFVDHGDRVGMGKCDGEFAIFAHVTGDVEGVLEHGTRALEEGEGFDDLHEGLLRAVTVQARFSLLEVRRLEDLKSIRAELEDARVLLERAGDQENVELLDRGLRTVDRLLQGMESLDNPPQTFVEKGVTTEQEEARITQDSPAVAIEVDAGAAFAAAVAHAREAVQTVASRLQERLDQVRLRMPSDRADREALANEVNEAIGMGVQIEVDGKRASSLAVQHRGTLVWRVGSGTALGFGKHYPSVASPTLETPQTTAERLDR